MKVITIDPAPQPALPAERPGGLPWPKLTLEWWERWPKEPISKEFSGPDWAFLMDTALLHAAVWAEGEVKLLGELRLRTAKFAVTPEDRARLRIQYSSADAAEERRDGSAAGARARRGQIRTLKPGEIGAPTEQD